MATGIIGTLNTTGVLSYTPPSNTKVNVALNNSSSSAQTAQVNGVAINIQPYSVVQLLLWIGAGKTLTINNPQSNTGVILSALES